MSAAGPPVALRETCRVVGGRVPLWAWHRARLTSGGCSAALLEAAEKAALVAAAGHPGARAGQRVRLSLGVGADGAVSAEVSRELSSLDVVGGPACVRVDLAEPLDLPPGAAKPLDRSPWDRAQRAAYDAGAHQAVLVGPDGLVIDGGTATVWAVEEGVLVTPPAPPAIAGVARAWLLGRTGVRTRVEPLAWERFEAAEEALLTNAFGGAAAVRRRGGSVCDTVAGLFAELWASA